MNSNQIEVLLKDLVDAILELVNEKSISHTQVAEGFGLHGKNFASGYSSKYNNDLKCLSYALRYGIKTAFQTYLSIDGKYFEGDIKRIFVVGGGCAFELPVILNYLPKGVKELEVRIIDKYANYWNIFESLHKRYAKTLGVKLAIKYVAFDLEEYDLIEYTKKYPPCLMVASNLLNELSEDLIEELFCASKEGRIFIQDMTWGKFSTLVGKILAGNFTSYTFKKHITGFPEDKLRNHLYSKEKEYKRSGVFSSIENWKYYQYINCVGVVT